MAIQQIEFEDKEAINIDSAVPDKNKCNASDLNEIKSVVNSNSYETPNITSQIDTDYKLNVLTTKNLFNKDNANIVHFYSTATGYAQNNNAVSIYIPIQEGKTYTVLSTNRSLLDTSASISYTNKIIESTSDTYLQRTSWLSSDNSVTTTAPSGATYMYVYFKWSTNQTDINNCLATIQVEYGNQATTYEAFIPNTINVNNEKYTDTINVGTDINSANRVNVLTTKNLFDKDNVNTLTAYINTSGVVVQDTLPSTLYIPCKPNTTYTITKPLQTTQSWNRYKYGCCSSIPTIQTQLSKFVALSGGTTETIQTFTTDSTAQYLVLNYAGGNLSEYQNVIDGLQIELGNQATTYEPFIKNTINVNNEKYTDTINVGTDINDKNMVNVLYSKNLLDLSNTQTAQGITSSYNSATGEFSFSGTSNAGYCNLTAQANCDIPSGTYTISLNHTFNKNMHLILSFEDSTSVDINIETNTTSKTFTTDKKAISQRFYTATTSGTTYNESFYIQLEKGSNATSFNKYIGTPSINIDGEEIYKQEKTEDFKGKITFNESLGNYNLFRKKGNLIMMNYQGANKSHTIGEVLFTLPVGYRPPIIILVPFTAYGVAYGQLAIGTNGNCYINTISSESASGRICFTATYTTD